MIIIGYQGIGKSTLARKEGFPCIDLESSVFYLNGERLQDWYIYYCNIAIELSNQGCVVFVSSHKCVRDYLYEKGNKSKIQLCYPILELRDKWIRKLEKRYSKTGLKKDHDAWLRSHLKYDEDIKELMGCDFNKLPIKSINYKLENIIFRGREK